MRLVTFASCLCGLGLSLQSVQAADLNSLLANCRLSAAQTEEIERFASHLPRDIAINTITFSLSKLGSAPRAAECVQRVTDNLAYIRSVTRVSESAKLSSAPLLPEAKPQPAPVQRVERGASRPDALGGSKRLLEANWDSIYVSTEGIEVIIDGQVNDYVARVEVNGRSIRVGPDGKWRERLVIPRNGLELDINLVDGEGNQNGKVFSIDRGEVPVDDSVEPIKPRYVDKQTSSDRVAIVIGVDRYRSLPNAIYAERDALSAYRTLTDTFGVAPNNIRDLIGSDANEVNIKLTLKQWLASRINPGRTELIIFYAGHGLVDDQGETRFWLPYDGHTALLEDTAISVQSLLDSVAALQPKSTLVFADSCYSGAARDNQQLTAMRPVRLVKNRQSLPAGTLFFSATDSDQVARPYEAAEHGLFSYWILKGLEGSADANGDRVITAGELHEYANTRVARLSGGAQVPTFSGDSQLELVRW